MEIWGKQNRQNSKCKDPEVGARNRKEVGVAGGLHLGGSSGSRHEVVDGAGVGGLEEGVWVWELFHRKNNQDLMMRLTKEEESGMNLRFLA